jgi:hypothetical protein
VMWIHSDGEKWMPASSVAQLRTVEGAIAWATSRERLMSEGSGPLIRLNGRDNVAVARVTRSICW